ncbi:MAG: hypothetical protein IPI46_09830 [Bacteroidetes bacterium]|nr:hypothetical protein [Bacteroidota bacterium]
MLTSNNYNEQVALIDYTALPSNLQKGYDFVKKSTQNYSNWDVYYKSEKIKEVIDLYFSKVNEYVPKLSTPKVVATKKEVVHKSAKVVKPKTEKKMAEPKHSEPPAHLVERLEEEIKIIKRFVNLNEKQKSQEDILRFINALQKAIVERKIRKTSAYAKEIEYIQKDLIMVYNRMSSKTVYYIPQEKLANLESIIGGEKIYPSIQYIKKYLNLVGKTGIKQKATALIKLMESAVAKGKVTSNDKYSDKMNDAFKTLRKFIDNPTEKTIEIDSQELNGLQGIVDGCNCTSLSGVDGEMPVVMNSMEFAKLEFNTIGLTGKWHNLIGDPSPNFTAMVFGKPKMGKSYLCIDFAGYMARNHGKVLYVAKEEGLDFTLQKKLNDKDVKHPNLFVASTLPNDITPYDFIFLDSVNKLGLLPEDLTALKRKYPTKSFIYIFQTTKEGNFRGANSFQHDVDVVIEIPERGKAVQFGRFNQGGEMGIF